MTLEQRISIANDALATIAPITLYQGARELRMKWGKQDFPARLRTDGSWPQFGYRYRCTGGTGTQALAQIIRYVRDLTRLPIETFQYWTGDRVKLGSSNTVEILLAGGYEDPLKTCCVLCGNRDYATSGLDWWSLDGTIGPACSYRGGCMRGWTASCKEYCSKGCYDDAYGGLL